MDGDETKMDELLRYIDGLMTPAEAKVFEEKLQNDAALNRSLHDLKEMENYLREKTLPGPSAAFTETVMHKVYAGPILWRRLINGLILILGITVVACTAAYLLANGYLDSSQATVAFDRVQQLNKFLPEVNRGISFDGKLMVNIVIFLNLALALIVLDRTVLKPFFQSRRTG